MSPDGRRPRTGDRIVVSLAVGCAAALIVVHLKHATPDLRNASDFTYYWRAGRALLEGHSPYAVINPVGAYPYDGGFLYPYPAALIASPFALLALWPAMMAFCGALAACLAYAMSRDGFWRLPLLMSFPMLWCAQSGQLAPLVVSAAFIPELGGLAIAKPTLAVAVFAHTAHRRFLLSAAIMLVVTVILAPQWPGEYVAEVAGRKAAYYRVPFFVGPGPLLALAALRWRRPEARLLLTMACVPQTMLFYDQLPLLTVARTFRQALVMALASYLPIIAIYFLPRPTDDSLPATLATTSMVTVSLYYVPCLLAILRRPNVGEVPGFVERASSRLPRWLRGSSLADEVPA